jgi:hypothetical protein
LLSNLSHLFYFQRTFLNTLANPSKSFFQKKPFDENNEKIRNTTNMSFMRNEDFGGEGKTSSEHDHYSNTSSRTSNLPNPDSDDARQRHLDKQREIERAKGKSRMGGVLARASAKPTSSGSSSPVRGTGDRGVGGGRSLSQFSRPRQQVSGPDTLDLKLGRYGTSARGGGRGGGGGAAGDGFDPFGESGSGGRGVGGDDDFDPFGERRGNDTLNVGRHAEDLRRHSDMNRVGELFFFYYL